MWRPGWPTGIGILVVPVSPPEQTLPYGMLEVYYPAFSAHLAVPGKVLPGYVQREFDDHLRCGRLEHVVLWMRCESCHVENLVTFSCKPRGFSPSCGARRMAECAAPLADEILRKAHFLKREDADSWRDSCMAAIDNEIS